MKWIIIAYFVGLLTVPLAALLITFKRYMVKRLEGRTRGEGG